MNIEHSVKQNEVFESYGLRSVHIDANTPDTERIRVYEQLEEGSIDILNNVDIITEGVDIPEIECVIMNRGIKSKVFYVQCNRGTRPLLDKNFNPVLNKDGSLRKPHCIVLDHGQNTLRHGFLEEYDQVRFTLEGRKKGKQPKEEETTKECPSCFAILKRFDKECAECGHKFERKKTEIMLTEGRPMVLLDRDAVTVQRIRGMDNKESKKLPLHLLRIAAMLKGYKDGWWYHAVIVTGKPLVYLP